MRRALLLALTLMGAAALTACPSKPKDGECKSNQDCLEQTGYGKVCVQGRCQECAQDADCMDGFVCRENKCAPKPQCTGDADCPEGQRCEAERCVVSAVAPPAEPEKPALAAECADDAAFTIRFGFDQATLTPDSQASLQRLADCVKQAPAERISVAGHADDRGTTEYNIALGSRRAEAARKYLSDLGVGTRLETVSFGEERPVCHEQSEDCWSRNRRAEFQVQR